MVFGYEVDILWVDVVCDVEYFLCDGVFQVYVCVQLWLQCVYIGIFDVVVIFVQVQCDEISVGFFSQQCCGDWVWVSGVVCVVQCGDVVDVDVQVDDFW